MIELQGLVRAEMDTDRTAAINSLDPDAKTDIERRADLLPQPLKSIDEPLGPSSRQTKCHRDQIPIGRQTEIFECVRCRYLVSTRIP